MIGYIQDDGGRKAAGFKNRKDAGDCVARALAILTNTEYRCAYDDLADANKRKTGKRTARDSVLRRVYEPVYENYGLRKVKLPRGPRPTYTEAHERYGDCIVKTAKHVCAIVGGNLRDTFDGRTYEWEDYDASYIRERKAQGVWVKA